MNKPYNNSGGSWSNHGGRSRRFIQDVAVSQGAANYFRKGHDTRFVPYHDERRRNTTRDRKRRNQRGVARDDMHHRNDENQWFKIMIPFGKKTSKEFILKGISGLCKVPFVPVNFHFHGNAAVFYVKDYITAVAIKEVNRKITTPEGFKMSVVMYRGPPPVTVVDPVIMEHIKTTMSERYNVQTKQLSLALFHEDPALKANGVYAPLQKKNVFDACVRIIKEHIPDLQSLHLGNNKIYMLEPLSSLVTTCKALRGINLSNNKITSMSELNNIKGMQIEELVLDGNPLCDGYKDQTTYISAVRDKLPKVVKLDGETLPAPIGFDLGTEEELPPATGSFFPSEDVKQLVVQFLEQYFSIYDSDNRQPLLGAYHDQALFSFSMSKGNTGRGGFQEYGMESRNLIYVTDSNLRLKLLNQGKLSVVSTLSKFPPTKHDPSSFVVDVSYVSTMLMMFTVTGVFKELPSRENRDHPLRTFSRTFIVVPQGQGFSIINETLVITNATVEQVKAHKMAQQAAPSVPLPVSVGPSSTDEKKRLALEMANMTGMNIDFSARCLEENDWNLPVSLNLFTELQNRGAIPPEAFQK